MSMIIKAMAVLGMFLLGCYSQQFFFNAPTILLTAYKNPTLGVKDWTNLTLYFSSKEACLRIKNNFIETDETGPMVYGEIYCIDRATGEVDK